jgi:hypothetical protein
MICGLPSRIKAPLMQQNHIASFTQTIPSRVVQNFCEKVKKKKLEGNIFWEMGHFEKGESFWR